MSEIAARLRRLPTDTLACLAFFTRLPVRLDPGERFDLKVSAAAWPIVGALAALGAAVVLAVTDAAGMPPMVSATLAVATLIGVSGGLHEDGLADTADGLGGGSSPEAKRDIMRDSRIGTYGVLALLVTVLVRVGALAALAPTPGQAAVAVIASAALSRSMALWHWHDLAPARPDGLARSAGRPDDATLMVGLILGGVAALLAVAAFAAAALIALALAAVATAGLNRLCNKQIGGHTGDTIGAAQQVSDALILAGLSAGAAAVL